jgi:hypothetical protein
MLEEAVGVGWPEAFQDDLYVHDLKKIDGSPGTPMVWILRSAGTHLYPTVCSNRHEAAYYRRVIEYWSGDHNLNLADAPRVRARYYLVTCSELRSIEWRDAKALVGTASDLRLERSAKTSSLP